MFHTKQESGALNRSARAKGPLPAAALIVFSFAGAVTVPHVAQAQERESAAKLVARTMANAEFRVKTFRGGEWLGSGDYYLALEPSGAGAGSDIVRYQTSTGARDILVAASRLIPAGEKTPLPVESYAMSPDTNLVLVFTNSKTVWRQNTRGDYWVLNLKSGALHKLGGDAPASSLMFAKFSPDNSKVGYVRGNNVYVEDLASGKITQLTRDGSDTVINGTSDWVNEEEFDIRDGFEWSPESSAIAFWQFNTSGVQNYTLIYDLGAPRGEIVTGIPYPNTGPYPLTLQYPYPLAGTPNSAVRVGVTPASGGKVVWMQTAGDPHNFYIPRMGWADAGHVLLQHMNRLQNKNEFLLAEATTGVSRTVFVDEDPAWVDVNASVLWINKGREFLVLSERDGWRHLYRVARDSGKVELVTSGDFDVVSIDRVTPDEKWIYFIASPDNPTQRYLYRVRMDGSAAPERLTPNQPGTHSYTISPNGEWAFHNYSTFDVPPTFEVVHLPDHRVMRITADNSALAERVKPLSSGPAEFVKVDAGNGLMVDAWLMKPPDFDPAKKYALIVNVYSEPAGQTTADRWPSMFDRALTSAGYLVASFDNEGTPAPRGREWRKVVYGNVGPLSSQQQATALQSLEKTYSFIDRKRVGVWGWSGGGTETLNLMFRYPEVYSVGVSVASVPDQRLYDSIYQERYMGLPQESPKAYEQSSAINFASGLRGDLMVMHGSGDDNVHFQGFELLVNKLISLGLQFDMRVYPGRTHGIFEGKGTNLDVYTNILGYFEAHLPLGPQATASH
ncbi:MAG TPA: DPP IV N-terminal domain-containing protein [Candidatus Acidoferrum sp.]|nr:DPP IV N-terminal domain-containing protein [Candidatus Acidoferrum sp.]